MKRFLTLSLITLIVGCKSTGTLYFTVKAISPSENTSLYFLKSGMQRVTIIDSNNTYQLGDTFKLVKLKKISN